MEDIWAISSFWPLWMKVLCTFLFKFPVNIALFLLGENFKVEWLGHRVWKFCLFHILGNIWCHFLNFNSLGGCIDYFTLHFSMATDYTFRCIYWQFSAFIDNSIDNDNSHIFSFEGFAQVYCPFFIGSPFLLLSFKSYLHIWHISTLSNIHYANIFSQSVAYQFHAVLKTHVLNKKVKKGR